METLVVVVLTIILSSFVIEGAFAVYQLFWHTSVAEKYRQGHSSAPDFDQGRYFRDAR